MKVAQNEKSLNKIADFLPNISIEIGKKKTFIQEILLVLWKG